MPFELLNATEAARVSRDSQFYSVMRNISKNVLHGGSYMEYTFPNIDDETVEKLEGRGYSVKPIERPYVSKRVEKRVYFHIIWDLDRYNEIQDRRAENIVNIEFEDFN